MVAAAAPANPPASGPPELSESQLDSLADRVTSRLKGLIPAGGGDGGSGSTGQGSSRRSLRDEEDDMRRTVESMLPALFAKEKANHENHPDPGQQKADPESVPAQREGRSVERFFGWN